MNIRFTSNGWRQFTYWRTNDAKMFDRVNELITETTRTPFTGTGKPEPLLNELSGWWSRRITGEHRLVYRIAGKAGIDQYVEIASCRFHYTKH